MELAHQAHSQVAGSLDEARRIMGVERKQRAARRPLGAGFSTSPSRCNRFGCRALVDCNQRSCFTNETSSCCFGFKWQNFSLLKPFLPQIPRGIFCVMHEQRPSSSELLPPIISSSEELLTSLESYSLATGLLMHHLAREPSEPS